MVMSRSLSFITRHLAPGISSAPGPSAGSLSYCQDRNEGEKQPEQSCDFTLCIPEECLAWILDKLPQKDRNTCSLVCRRWHSVDSKTRVRLTLKAEAELVPTIPALLCRFKYVSYLSLKCTRKINSVDNAALLVIAKLCKHLIRLKIRGCKLITDEGLEEFSKMCGSLKKFSCGSCGFGAHGLNAILQNCNGLEDLSVRRLRRLIDTFEVIVPGKSKLKRLSLKDLANAQLFGTLLTGSAHLQTLVLSKNCGYWDSLFEIVTVYLPRLFQLHIDSMRLGDRGLKAISRCSELEILYLIKVSDCSDTGLSAIANGCRKLRKLHLDNRKSNKIGDEGLLAVANSCFKLQELVLIGVNVTISSLGFLASNCLDLERMALCNSDAVGDAEMSCIADKCVSLRKLCIKNCAISGNGLELFANGCPNLSKVKVKKCKNVTIVSAYKLQMNRSSLIISLDSPDLGADGHIERHQQPDSRHIRAPTTQLCSSSPLLKDKLSTAAGNILKRFSKASQ